MRLLREWGFPIALFCAWWFGLVWALTVMIAPVPQPSRAKPPNAVTPKVEARRS